MRTALEAAVRISPCVSFVIPREKTSGGGEGGRGCALELVCGGSNEFQWQTVAQFSHGGASREPKGPSPAERWLEDPPGGAKKKQYDGVYTLLRPYVVNLNVLNGRHWIFMG